MAKILVIDDGDVHLAFVCTALNIEGHEVIPFEDATKALRHLQDVNNDLPDLIISDVVMPAMDGYTFHNTLQQEERTRKIPIIIMTGKHSLRTSFEASKNVAAFLEKPLDITILSETVKKVLRTRKS